MRSYSTVIPLEPMQETIQEYKIRINGYVGSHDPIALQQAMPEKLANLIHWLKPEQVTIRPAADKWSISEIVAHLADDELVGAYRIRRILCEPGSNIEAFDQDRWASLGQYNSINLEQSFQLFRQLRLANLFLFSNLKPEQWQYYGLHAERGKETIAAIAHYYAGHDINHYNQIEAILAKQALQ